MNIFPHNNGLFNVHSVQFNRSKLNGSGTSQDCETVTSHFVYTIAEGLVPEKFKRDFERQFKPEKGLAFDEQAIDGFSVTPTRQPIVNQLNALLDLRMSRKEATNNDVQKYGGLGGIIIEGSSGIGKSAMVIKLLISQGYIEQHDLIKPASTEQIFYRIPVSMALDEKETLLLKAFDEGAIVIIDEINSSVTMERLLNSLLMGKKPDGSPPHKPGFMVIGTQNPPPWPADERQVPHLPEE